MANTLPLQIFNLKRETLSEFSAGLDEVVKWHSAEKPNYPDVKLLYLIIIDDQDKNSLPSIHRNIFYI